MSLRSRPARALCIRSPAWLPRAALQGSRHRPLATVRPPRKTAAMNSCEKSTAGIGCRPACAFHSASHSARDRTTTSEASLIPWNAPGATVVTGGVALWAMATTRIAISIMVCQVTDSPPSRHRVSLHAQTRKATRLKSAAARSCESQTMQIREMPGFSAGARQGGCPCRHKLHTLFEGSALSDPVPVQW